MGHGLSGGAHESSRSVRGHPRGFVPVPACNTGSDVPPEIKDTSAFQPLVQISPGVLAFQHRFLSGYSSSTDGGKTWVSSAMPPLPGSIFTFGDPAIATDRNGNFYFAGLGADSAGRFTIQVNRSTNGGRTFGAAVLVQQDDGGDKEWIAVGKDPAVPSRDNVYVTWTSFQASGAQLRLGRSFDGGAWSRQVSWWTQEAVVSGSRSTPGLPCRVASV